MRPHVNSTVWKFTLRVDVDYQCVTAPAGARALTLQLQHGKPQLWMLVDPAEPPIKIGVRTVATGDHIGADELAALDYVGTYQLFGGSEVNHVFLERLPPK